MSLDCLSCSSHKEGFAAKLTGPLGSWQGLTESLRGHTYRTFSHLVANAPGARTCPVTEVKVGDVTATLWGLSISVREKEMFAMLGFSCDWKRRKCTRIGVSLVYILYLFL